MRLSDSGQRRLSLSFHNSWQINFLVIAPQIDNKHRGFEYQLGTGLADNFFNP